MYLRTTKGQKWVNKDTRKKRLNDKKRTLSDKKNGRAVNEKDANKFEVFISVGAKNISNNNCINGSQFLRVISITGIKVFIF